MKLIFTYIVILGFSIISTKKPMPNKVVDIKSFVKGIVDLPSDSNNKRIYLIELNIKNISDSVIVFLTQSCMTIDNLVFDSKEIIPLANNCLSISIAPIILKPNQEFSFVFMITSKKHFPEILKVGWIFLKPENIGDIDNYYKVLANSAKRNENIIWSNPIGLFPRGANPFEIR